MILPKPSKRTPKPPQRIARRVRPRAKRRGKVAEQKHSLAYLWRVAVRKKNGGRCLVATKLGLPHQCDGPIQAAHCFGVDEAPGLRLTLWNGVPLCARHHELTERYKDSIWRVFLEDLWGGNLFAERLSLARTTVKVDLAAARAALEAAA